MKTIIILAFMSCALAHGGFGMSRQEPVSCQTQDNMRGQMHECAEKQLSDQGYTIDRDAVHQCFENCKETEGEMGGHHGNRGGHGRGFGGGHGKGFGGGGGHHGKGGDELRELFQCIDEKVEPQIDQCVQSKINFQVEERSDDWEKMGRGGRQRRQMQMGGKGLHGGHGRGNGMRMFKNLLERAQQCGIEPCVRSAVSANVLDNPDGFKTAMCQAMKQCRDQMQSQSQCHEEMMKLRQAQCECNQEVDRDSATSECEASTGKTLPDFGGKGRGGHHNMDCSSMGHHHDDDEC